MKAQQRSAASEKTLLSRQLRITQQFPRDLGKCVGKSEQ
jgi:hypothetical protein